MWKREAQIVVTRHAIRRMVERGCSPDEVHSFLQRHDYLPLQRNQAGYEITIPFKGRLVGDFDKRALIIKSFLWPMHFAKEYNENCRKSGDSYIIGIESVSFPDGVDTLNTRRWIG